MSTISCFIGEPRLSGALRSVAYEIAGLLTTCPLTTFLRSNKQANRGSQPPLDIRTRCADNEVSTHFSPKHIVRGLVEGLPPTL